MEQNHDVIIIGGGPAGSSCARKLVAAGLDVLVIQDPANDGTLKTVGPIGVDVPDAAGMDVATDGQGKDHAWAAWGTSLYTLDLATGRATPVGPIPGATHPVISLAILDDLP